MAKKTIDRDDEPAVEAIEPPKPLEIDGGAGAHPQTVFLDVESGDLVPVLSDAPRNFQITVGGATYYHQAETPDGAWIYRKG